MCWLDCFRASLMQVQRALVLAIQWQLLSLNNKFTNLLHYSLRRGIPSWGFIAVVTVIVNHFVHVDNFVVWIYCDNTLVVNLNIKSLQWLWKMWWQWYTKWTIEEPTWSSSSTYKHSSLKHLKILKSAENEPSDVPKNELLIQKY